MSHTPVFADEDTPVAPVGIPGDRRAPSPFLPAVTTQVERPKQNNATTNVQLEHQYELLNSLIRKIELLLTASGEGADAAVEKGIASNTQLMEAWVSQSNAVLASSQTGTAHLEKLMQETDHQWREMLEQSKAVGHQYRKLVDKTVAERDNLAAQLREANKQSADTSARQARSYEDLQQTFVQARQHFDTALKRTQAELQVAHTRVAELESQLAEALDSRDLIARKVESVEAQMERTLIPIRQELDAAQRRATDLETQLEAARQDIQGLRLLLRPLPQP